MSAFTLVLGASTNPDRYSNKAIRMLRQYGEAVIAVGLDSGEVAGVPIRKTLAEVTEPVDTLTMYLGAARQTPLIPAILALKPRRIVFNPGAENPELEAQATAAGIHVVEACTLVLLSTGQYAKA